MVPDVEAFDVKLNALARLCADGLDDGLSWADLLSAGVAFFPVGSAAPESRDAVLREVTANEPTPDNLPNCFEVHASFDYESRPGASRSRSQ